MLEGYKTYIIAAVVAIMTALEVAGVDIPGFDVQQDWLVMLLGSGGLATLRAAIAKAKI